MKGLILENLSKKRKYCAATEIRLVNEINIEQYSVARLTLIKVNADCWRKKEIFFKNKVPGP